MIRVLWVSLIFLLICSCSCAEEATEIEPAYCTASVNDSYTQALSDDSYFTVWYAKRGNVRIELPENQPAYSMYICFNRQVVPIVIQIPDENGGYSDLATVSDPFLTVEDVMFASALKYDHHRYQQWRQDQNRKA